MMLGAFSSAVGFAAGKVANNLENYKNNVANDKKYCEDVLKVTQEEKEPYSGKVPFHPREDPTGSLWNSLHSGYQNYGTEIEFLRKFDPYNGIKCGNLHIRSGDNIIKFHYDKFDVVLQPVRHIIYDTLWQLIRYGVE